MRLPDRQVATVPPNPGGRAVIVTSYGTGAERGENLGERGYSSDIVAQLFVPLVSRWGEVIPAARDTASVEAAIEDARRRGLDPVHLGFVACQDMVFARSAPNVILPAWEYPDVPAEAFDGNAQNNWVSTANRCDLVLACAEFTAEALRRAGVRVPVRVVPVPTPDEYFRVPPWRPGQKVRISCPAHVCPAPEVPASELWDAPDPVERLAGWPDALGRLIRRAWERHGERFSPPLLAEGVRRMVSRLARNRWHTYLRRCRRAALELSGVVYVSLLNPAETRENWQDLLTGFISALGDRPDATLILKLVTGEPARVGQILDFYRGVGLSHQCKIVFVSGYLPPVQMLALARASTYYLTTARAERYGLPLRDHLAAGRPAISPCHSAVAEDVSEEVGLTIPWQPEPAPWPQDRRARIRTTWARLDWGGLVERLRESYALARYDRRAYDARAECARRRMKERAGAESIWPRLAEALSCLDTVRGRAARVA